MKPLISLSMLFLKAVTAAKHRPKICNETKFNLRNVLILLLAIFIFYSTVAFTIKLMEQLWVPLQTRGEIRDTETLNLSRNFVSFHVLGRCSRFSSYVINLSCNNLSWIHTKQINQSARCISSTRNNKCLLRDKMISEVKNAIHRPKTCNETTLRDKLRALVSHISPPKGT